MPFLQGSEKPQCLLKTNLQHKTPIKVEIFRKENDREENSLKKLYNNSNNSVELIKKSLEQKRHAFPRLQRASITIEAAIALPMAIFSIYLMLFQLKVMEAERRLQNSMEQTAEYLTAAEYFKNVGEGLLDIDSDHKETAEDIAAGIETGMGLAAVMAAADTTVFENLFFSADTHIFTESDDGMNVGSDGSAENAAEADATDISEDMVLMELCYQLKLPLTFFEISPVSKSIITNRRAWIGAEGGRGRSEYSDAYDGSEESENEDRTVYLGKTSSEVYHENPECHYLSNKMSSISAEKISEERNSGGGKYYPCSSCRPDSSGIVYYFESGSSYHSSEKCKAITSYARTAKLSELTGMRPCSYCGKGHT